VALGKFFSLLVGGSATFAGGVPHGIENAVNRSAGSGPERLVRRTPAAWSEKHRKPGAGDGASGDACDTRPNGTHAVGGPPGSAAPFSPRWAKRRRPAVTPVSVAPTLTREGAMAS
jgi:hypothetical protein